MAKSFIFYGWKGAKMVGRCWKYFGSTLRPPPGWQYVFTTFFRLWNPNQNLFLLLLLGGKPGMFFTFHPYLGRWSNLTTVYFQIGSKPPTQLATLSLSTSLDVANFTQKKWETSSCKKNVFWKKQIQRTLILHLYTFSDFQCLSRDSHIFFLENLGRSSSGGFL